MLSRCRPLLGTFVEITADDAGAIDVAFAAVERVHRLMSAHEPDSDVSRINRFGHLKSIQVDDWTRRVIERSLYWSKLSQGAFDVVRAGKRAVEQGLIPRHSDQPRAVASHWTWLEIRGGSVRLLEPGCIDLGGIAKGYAVDLAVAALQQAGARSGLVNAGGDLRGFGDASWPVTVVDPRRSGVVEVELDNAGLATSAGLPAGAGLSFAHMTEYDPRWISVTVRAPNACDADALTKIVWALGHRAADLLAAARADAFAIRADGTVEAIDHRALAA